MLHGAKPPLNGVTHCHLCQARNGATTHPLMKAVTYLLGLHLLIHIHCFFPSLREVSFHRWKFLKSPVCSLIMKVIVYHPEEHLIGPETN